MLGGMGWWPSTSSPGASASSVTPTTTVASNWGPTPASSSPTRPRHTHRGARGQEGRCLSPSTDDEANQGEAATDAEVKPLGPLSSSSRTGTSITRTTITIFVTTPRRLGRSPAAGHHVIDAASSAVGKALDVGSSRACPHLRLGNELPSADRCHGATVIKNSLGTSNNSRRQQFRASSKRPNRGRHQQPQGGLWPTACPAECRPTHPDRGLQSQGLSGSTTIGEPRRWQHPDRRGRVCRPGSVRRGARYPRAIVPARPCRAGRLYAHCVATVPRHPGTHHQAPSRSSCHYSRWGENTHTSAGANHQPSPGPAWPV